MAIRASESNTSVTRQNNKNRLFLKMKKKIHLTEIRLLLPLVYFIYHMHSVLSYIIYLNK